MTLIIMMMCKIFIELSVFIISICVICVPLYLMQSGYQSAYVDVYG